MKLLLKIERRKDGSIVDSTSTVLNGDSISIGRGAGAQIHLQQQRVAPIQALLELTDEGLLIREIGHAGLLLVNGKKVHLATLADGDVASIAGTDLQVGNDNGLWSIAIDGDALYIEREDQEVINEQLNAFNLKNNLPSLLTVSLAIMFLFTFIYFFLPIESGDKDSWSSGPLSSAHQFIERDCQACHGESFAPIVDKNCIQCHSVGDHLKETGTNGFHQITSEANCVDCHFEHNGDRSLIVRDSRQCVSCHGDIKAVKKESNLLNVSSLASHPEFRISFGSVKDVVTHTVLSDSTVTDKTAINLNHEVHLKADIRGENGNVTLECTDCHALNADKKNIEPISFERNCRSCHSLEFDPRFARKEVPHGSEEKIREYLIGQYSAFFLAPAEQKKIIEQRRSIPGVGDKPAQINKATESLVAMAVANAESTLYNNTGCQLCHQSLESKGSEDSLVKREIVKPNIPQEWFAQARFDHKPHLFVKCSDCHQGVLTSTKTADVLLPKVDSCRECHADPGVLGKIASDCVECHGYHPES